MIIENYSIFKIILRSLRNRNHPIRPGPQRPFSKNKCSSNSNSKLFATYQKVHLSK